MKTSRTVNALLRLVALGIILSCNCVRAAGVRVDRVSSPRTAGEPRMSGAKASAESVSISLDYPNNFYAGLSYLMTVTVSGASIPCTWRFTQGPEWIVKNPFGPASVDGRKVFISGTPGPSDLGESTLGISVTDAENHIYVRYFFSYRYEAPAGSPIQHAM